MRILVSNDDGYFAPGINALVGALQGLGEVVVVAPEQDRSGTSHSLTLDRPLTVRQAPNGFHYVDGTPADCVHLALTTLFDQLPDLVVSGINDGANLGDDTLYSGTVAAAMEGLLVGVPALAFSLVRRHSPHLDAAAQGARAWVERFIRDPLPPGMMLNINFPSLPAGEVKPAVVTRLGRRTRGEPAVPATTPRGHRVYWIGAAGAVQDAEPGTDFDAIAQGHVSVTPLQPDLTATARMDATRQWLHR